MTWGPRLSAQPTAHLRHAMLAAPGPAIDLAVPLAGEPNAVHGRALAQIGVLAKTLRYFGCEVTELAEQPDDPLASAVAQSAVVLENGAVLMRARSMQRRAQAAWLEETFARMDVPIAGHIAAPGFIDGADVLLAGSTAFIGVGPASNELGRRGFAHVASAHGFTPVEVRLGAGARCLRAVAGVVAADHLVVADARFLDHAALRGFKTTIAPLGHELGAGVLNLGDGHVLAGVRFQAVNDRLRADGVTVEAIDLYDFDRIGLTPSMLVLDLKRA